MKQSDRLNGYISKRDFTKTNEPAPTRPQKAAEGIYAIQKHASRREHYDLRLECNGTLLSWAVPNGPSLNPKDKRLAVHVEDHPIEYAGFEGTIPKGEYGGGTVMLWDEGTWDPIGENVGSALAKGVLKFALHGKRLQGKWALVQMKPSGEQESKNWLLIKENDEYAMKTPGISAYTKSIRSSHTMKQIEKESLHNMQKNPFSTASPQLAMPADSPPGGKGWVFESKYDGYRMLAFIEGGEAALYSRNGKSYTHRFPEIAMSLQELAGKRAIALDGEIVAYGDDGNASFQMLQNYLRHPNGANIIYFAFDLLALDGKDLRNVPLLNRKEALLQLLDGAPANIKYSRHVEGNGQQCLIAAANAGMEGIIAKRADSIYSGKRSHDWLKIKCSSGQEFVVCGYTLSEQRNIGFSSLLLGYYEGGNLVYAGRVGTGFSEKEKDDLIKSFSKLQRKTPPFADPPKNRKTEKTIWLRPTLVCEVKFTEWTNEGLLRHASYKGMRQDKKAGEVAKESANLPKAVSLATPKGKAPQADIVVGGVRISNPGKAMYANPTITKEDVANYYLSVSQRMLEYSANRILSVVRYPNGIDENSFYKKRPDSSETGIKTTLIADSSGEEKEFFYISSAQGLLAEAQMCTIEFHTWGSKAGSIEKPDIMVFDLDPDEGLSLAKIRKGALDLREVLASLSLESFVKTSGGKGYHVQVPFAKSSGWEAFNAFAKKVAELMQDRWPGKYTANSRKNNREGKIFIDWMRNSRGATSIAAYSLRARPGASVSMPITWDEVGKVAPDGIKINNAIKRISQSDPWKGFYNLGQKLK
ncbi:MAG: DNA ligase D [Eubacteriaceae bacterium]|nr:DNA ligase D [Eubacteriaceae bacterium]